MTMLLLLQVLVGPGTPRAAHPITPPEVADFVNNSRAGVVLVAFGSTAQSASLLSREDFVQLAQGFADLAPVRVLWPLKEVALPTGVTVAGLNLASNVKIVPWVDYNVSGPGGWLIPRGSLHASVRCIIWCIAEIVPWSMAAVVALVCCCSLQRALIVPHMTLALLNGV